ncbi:MAG: hypothetical protein ABEH58_03505, partial [Haloplanus sp.]
LLVVRETALSVGTVVIIGIFLFAISGVWPPMVAVESGSMEPHMHKGDLVFITDSGRFAPDAAHGDTGVVPKDVARDVGYRKFGAYGSVIVYDNPRDAGPPVRTTLGHGGRELVRPGEPGPRERERLQGDAQLPGATRGIRDERRRQRGVRSGERDQRKRPGQTQLDRR